tara:strand:+ start:864 stop:1235 length:372 start_codon:yes stop_codon:yes gene_type:complete
MNKSNKEFIKHYLVTALWSSIDTHDNPLDGNYDSSNIDFDSIKRAVKDCKKFIEKCEKENLLNDVDYSTAGHDFWLTRNHHGAGFWDGDYPEHGDRLTEISQEFNEIDCTNYYENENELIEIY